MTTVGIVGPGRAGTLVAAGFARAGDRVTVVAGGAAAARERFAERFPGARVVEEVAGAAAGADLLVLAVADDAIAEVADGLAVADVLTRAHRVIHLSGAHGLAPLRRAQLAGAAVAACHPAMTIPRDSTDPDVLVGVAWGVTARDPDWPWAAELVARLGGDAVRVADAHRALYHAALAVGSNAAAAAVATARRLLLAGGIDRPDALLGPLVDASVRNAEVSGVAALTGPVVRGDVGTVTNHVAAIDADVPELAAAYRDAMRLVLDQVRVTLDDDVVAALTATLAPAAPEVSPAPGTIGEGR